MPSAPRNRWVWAGLAAALLSGLLWALLAGESDDGDPAPAAPAGAVPVEPGGGAGPPERERERGSGPEEGSAGASAEQRKAARRRRQRAAVRSARRSYRDYLAAIDSRDGARVCALIAPGFERELRPPVRDGGCARRISASIGFEDKRGFPVWERTTLNGFESALLGAGLRVQLTAAIVTAFRDREQPSVESDVAYLEPDGDGGYRLAKATGALWRAVGKPDVPLSVVEPPPGFGGPEDP